MHEWGLAQRILKQIEDEAQARRLTRISRVRVETAALNAAECEALRFNFESAARDSIAEDAVLDIVAGPGQALCPVCLSEVTIADHHQPCPRCGAQPLTMLHADSVRITELVAT